MSHNFGYGVGDDMGSLLAKYGDSDRDSEPGMNRTPYAGLPKPHRVSESRKEPKLCSERILQPKLQLAHGDSGGIAATAAGQGVDSAKALVGRIRRRTGICRARQDIVAGAAEVRMVQQIERFRAELKLVTFFVRQAEVFVYFAVDRENSWSEGRVASDVAELCERCYDEGCTVVPSIWTRVRDAGADAR